MRDDVVRVINHRKPRLLMPVTVISMPRDLITAPIVMWFTLAILAHVCFVLFMCSFFVVGFAFFVGRVWLVSPAGAERFCTADLLSTGHTLRKKAQQARGILRHFAQCPGMLSGA